MNTKKNKTIQNTKRKENTMQLGDGGLGIGDWGLGIGDWGLGPIPNPQSPIPNPQLYLNCQYCISNNKII